MQDNMNEMELKLLWQSANERFTEQQSINRKYMEEITRMKVGYLLSTMKPLKIVTLISGVVWVFFFGGWSAHLFINEYESTSPFLLYSMLLQVLLTAIATGMYMYQLLLIGGLDYAAPVVQIQERLAQLRASTLNVARILFLQLPIWTTFYWNESMLLEGNAVLWTLQGLVTLSFTVLSIWLFVQIRYENRDKKWFRLLFSGSEWQPVLQSMEWLKQMQQPL